MSRYFIVKPRIIEVHWDSDRNVYTLRLIEGSDYITPLLTVTPLDVLSLYNHRKSVDLGGWVRLLYRSNRSLDLYVTSQKGRWTEEFATFWPEVDGGHLHSMLKELRGRVDPTLGWEDVDARLAADQGW